MNNLSGRTIQACLLTLIVCVGPALSASDTVVLVDGDTLKYQGETIRLIDIDTPESFHSRCERELVLALEAKERLRQLVDAGPD